MVPAAVRTAAQLLSRVARQIVREPQTSALGARMALWIVLVSAAARMTSLHTTLALVSLGNGRRSRSTPDPEYLARTIDRVLRVDLRLFKPRCWKRSLVLYRYLTGQGIMCRINFGLRREGNGTLAGHAWLEREGQPFLESDISTNTYIVTFSLPGADDTRGMSAARHELPYDIGR